MPRKPKSELVVEDEETVSADDFLASLDEDDTPIYLEGDEKVTEADIARELGIDLENLAAPPAEDPPVKRGPGRPRKNPVPVVQPGDAVSAPEDDILAELAAPPSHDSKALFEIGRNTSRISETLDSVINLQKTYAQQLAEGMVKVNSVHEAISVDLPEALDALGKTLASVSTMVAQIHQRLHSVPKAAPRAAAAAEAPASEAEEPAPQETKPMLSVVSDHVEREVRTIVASIPKGSRALPVSQLAEVICRKRFNENSKVLSEIVAIIRTRLSDLGSVTQDDNFHRL